MNDRRTPSGSAAPMPSRAWGFLNKQWPEPGLRGVQPPQAPVLHSAVRFHTNPGRRGQQHEPDGFSTFSEVKTQSRGSTDRQLMRDCHWGPSNPGTQAPERAPDQSSRLPLKATTGLPGRLTQPTASPGSPLHAQLCVPLTGVSLHPTLSQLQRIHKSLQAREVPLPQDRPADLPRPSLNLPSLGQGW